MNARTTVLRAAAFAAAALCSLSAKAGAQAWNYPSFQPPEVVNREYNFAVADGGGAGTAFIFQWREGLSPRSQLSLDAGLADPEGGDTKFLLGGQFAYQLVTATATVPFDLLLTAGAYGAFVNGTLVRLPVGVSVGRRFPLEGGLAITPYVHPRMAIDICASCDTGDNSDVSLDFDIGANFEFTPQFALRFSGLFTGADDRRWDNAFGLSLAWRPPGLTRR